MPLTLGSLLAASRSPGRTLGATTSDDSGVSPVIGMILVLAISVVAIAATVYWGVPAIDEMKANVETRSVEAQFQDLDSTVQELIAGTTARTSKRWQPSFSRGSLSITDDVEHWVFAMEPHSATYRSMVYRGFSDGDSEFVLRNHGADLASVKVEAYRVQGSASEDPLDVSLDENTPAQMSGTLTLTNGTESQFWVFNRSTQQPVSLRNGTFHIMVYAGSDLVSEGWYVPVGRAKYDLETSLGTRHVVYTNGGIFTGAESSLAMENSPGVVPPTTTAGTYRSYARAVMIDGNTSFAGGDRFDVLLTLYSTVTLASYDCAESDYSDCAQSAKLFIEGDHASAWRDYLDNTNLGYSWTETTVTNPSYGGGTTTFLEDRHHRQAYTLLESILTVR